jgi:hypothetical protein
MVLQPNSKLLIFSSVVPGVIIRFVLLIFSFLLSLNAYCQTAPTIQWQKSLGGTLNDHANYGLQTTDGGYIMVGGTFSNDGDVVGHHGYIDCWVVKVDLNGSIQWQRPFGGSSYDDGFFIQQTTDGGYIIAAESASNDGDGSANHGQSDFWIIKITSTGNIQWQKTYGGSSGDGATCIRQTTDGGYIVAGYTISNDGDVNGNHGLSDFWVIKIDQAGNLQWQKAFGGSNYELANCIRQTPDGGYIVYGQTRSNNGDVTGFHGSYDYWVIKLNSTGNLQWQKAFGGSNLDNPTTISLTNDGGYIMTGQSNSTDGDVTGNHGNDDAWVIKVDINGNIQWKKCFGGPGVDPGMDIQQLSDGKYILLCHSTSSSGDASSNHGQWDYWFLQMDINGVILWEKSYGGSLNDVALAAQKTTDNGYVLFGYSKSNDGDVTNNHGVEDYWIVKLNPSLVTSTVDLTYLNQLYLFPNPTNGKIDILNTNNYRFYYSIYDITGGIIKEETMLNSLIDISPYSSGFYIIQIRSNRTVRNIKIIKR